MLVSLKFRSVWKILRALPGKLPRSLETYESGAVNSFGAGELNGRLKAQATDGRLSVRNAQILRNLPQLAELFNISVVGEPGPHRGRDDH